MAGNCPFHFIGEVEDYGMASGGFTREVGGWNLGHTQPTSFTFTKCSPICSLVMWKVVGGLTRSAKALYRVDPKHQGARSTPPARVGRILNQTRRLCLLPIVPYYTVCDMYSLCDLLGDVPKVTVNATSLFIGLG